MKSSLDKLGKESATAKQLEVIKLICKKRGLSNLDPDEKWTKQRASEYISMMMDIYNQKEEDWCTDKQKKLIDDICTTLNIHPPPNCKRFENDRNPRWCSKRDAREFIKLHIEEYKKVAPITDRQFYRIKEIESNFKVKFDGKSKYDAMEFISKYYSNGYDEDKFAWYTEEDFY